MAERYTHRLFDSIDSVTLTDWSRVCASRDDPFFMDPRFVRAVESGLKKLYEFWFLLIYDENAQPVACACLSTVTIDLANLAHPAVGKALRRFPWALSRFRHLKLLFCGLPVSAGQSSVVMTPGCDKTRVISELDQVVRGLVSKARAHTVVYKEFGEPDLAAMNHLLDLGYRRIATPPMHCLPSAFQDFESYYAALRSHYRYKVQRSLRKRQQGRIEVRVLDRVEDIVGVYTPDVHALYYQVLERSETRVETLTREFFLELARALPGQVSLVVLSRDSRIVAIAWSLQTGDSCHLLFVGLDYALNEECDLYFNLLYAWLHHALGTGSSVVKLGQTTDAFKARLGCYTEPRYAFMKGVGPVMSLVNRGLASLVVARESAPPALRVFKDPPGA